MAINSSPPSAAYMRQWIGLTSVEVMACKAITWTNVDLLSIGTLGTKFSEIGIKIQNIPFTKVVCEMAVILSRGGGGGGGGGGGTMPLHCLDTVYDEYKMVFCYLQIQLAISHHWFRYWLGAKQFFLNQ